MSVVIMKCISVMCGCDLVRIRKYVFNMLVNMTDYMKDPDTANLTGCTGSGKNQLVLDLTEK